MARHTSAWIADAAPNRTELREAAADFVRGFAPWTHFGSFTFVADVSTHFAEEAIKVFRTRALVAASGGRHVPYAIGVGLQQSGRTHFHALIAMPPGSSENDVSRAWELATRRAESLVETLISPLGAALYMTAHDSWDAGVACPRASACRRAPAGCVEEARLASRRV